MRWRSVMGWGALALSFTATHWPRLELPEPMEGGDQTVHLAVFMVVGLAAWNAGWFQSPTRFLIAALAWSALDESLQAIPVLHRWSTGGDFLANAAGVTCAWLLIRAVAPRRGEPRMTVTSLLAGRPHASAAVMLGMLVWGMSLGVSVVLLQSFASDAYRLKPLPAAIVGVTVGAAAGAGRLLIAGLRHAESGDAHSPLFPCGALAAGRSLVAVLIAFAAAIALTWCGVAMRAWSSVVVEPDLIAACAAPFLLALLLGAAGEVPARREETASAP